MLFAVLAGMMTLVPVSQAQISLGQISLGQIFQKKYPDKKSLSPYVTSPPPVVMEMLELARPKANDVIYDLGCGDGRIVMAAAQKYHIKAVGIELSDNLVNEARQNIASHHLESLVKVEKGDIMQADISPATIVTLYLSTTANETLRPLLEKNLKPKTRVVSYDYPIPGWKPLEQIDRQQDGHSHPIYLYQVPDSFTH
jgi:protein-L-isoaspartate O-methyltransferase